MRKGQGATKPSRNGNLSGMIRKVYILMGAIFALLVLGYACFTLFRNRPYELEYQIKPYSTTDKTIEVNLTVKNLHRNQELELYKGDVQYSDLICYENPSSKIKLQIKDSIIRIGIHHESNLRLTYKAKLGGVEKHGHRGEVYNDLLTFDGEQALMLPNSAFSTSEEEIKKSIGRISITYDIPENWTAVVPYSVADGNKRATLLTKPTWADIYDLGKSCYAFGKFKRYELGNGNGTLSVFTDPEYQPAVTEEMEQGIGSLYSYYTGLFEKKSPRLSIVLLRKDSKDGQYLIGGSSAQTLGTTFDPESARDWELMGHRFFHAFFESSIREVTFHAPPQLWFYEGLVTYYENMSMDCLPLSIRQKTGLDASEDFLMLYKQYIYMRIKDKYLYSVAPMDEEKVENHAGIIEFLHYTEAPLIIKAVDDLGYTKYGEHDRLLRYILNSHEGTSPSLSEIVKYALGEDANHFENQYMFHSDLLPLWYLADNKRENAGGTLGALSSIEYTLWTWLRHEDQEYPLDEINGQGMQVLEKEAEKAGVHFASPDIEEKIKKMSPTAYSLLLQYAFRAKICGVDLNDKLLRYKLLGDRQNIRTWENEKKSLEIRDK